MRLLKLISPHQKLDEKKNVILLISQMFTLIKKYRELNKKRKSDVSYFYYYYATVDNEK